MTGSHDTQEKDEANKHIFIAKLSTCDTSWCIHFIKYSEMAAWWEYGVLFCNSFMTFGVYYFMEFPIGVQSELMNNNHYRSGSNNTRNEIDCKVCLGLGEVRYNVLFAITRWVSIPICLPSGVLIDKLGNGRSAILFSILPMIGSVMFIIGAWSAVPVTTPMYILMLIGNCLLSFGDGALRFVQTRVVAHCFPDGTFIALAFGTFGYFGQCVSLYVTPVVATSAGLLPALCLCAVTCALGVLCAVGLALLLRIKPTPGIADDRHNKMLTIGELQALPVTYWLYVIAMGLTTACWIVKQVNLPDYLELQHGYSMTEGSYITGISSLVFLLSPVLCYVLKKVDCDGIIAMTFLAWMVPLFALLGFSPAVSVIIIALGDGIGITILTVMTWQLLVILCPASYVGTLGGLMYLVANIISALTLVVSGYILQRHNIKEMEDALLLRYQHFFLMLIVMSSISVICGTVMNVLDIQKTGALNTRIRRWQQSNIESTGIMSMIQPPNKYCGVNDEGDESPMKVD